MSGHLPTTFSNNVNVSGSIQGLNNTMYGYLGSISSMFNHSSIYYHQIYRQQIRPLEVFQVVFQVTIQIY